MTASDTGTPHMITLAHGERDGGGRAEGGEAVSDHNHGPATITAELISRVDSEHETVALPTHVTFTTVCETCGTHAIVVPFMHLATLSSAMRSVAQSVGLAGDAVSLGHEHIVCTEDDVEVVRTKARADADAHRRRMAMKPVKHKES